MAENKQEEYTIQILELAKADKWKAIVELCCEYPEAKQIPERLEHSGMLQCVGQKTLPHPRKQQGKLIYPVYRITEQGVQRLYELKARRKAEQIQIETFKAFTKRKDMNPVTEKNRIRVLCLLEEGKPISDEDTKILSNLVRDGLVRPLPASLQHPDALKFHKDDETDKLVCRNAEITDKGREYLKDHRASLEAEKVKKLPAKVIGILKWVLVGVVATLLTLFSTDIYTAAKSAIKGTPSDFALTLLYSRKYRHITLEMTNRGKPTEIEYIRITAFSDRSGLRKGNPLMDCFLSSHYPQKETYAKGLGAYWSGRSGSYDLDTAETDSASISFTDVKSALEKIEQLKQGIIEVEIKHLMNDKPIRERLELIEEPS